VTSHTECGTTWLSTAVRHSLRDLAPSPPSGSDGTWNLGGVMERSYSIRERKLSLKGKSDRSVKLTTHIVVPGSSIPDEVLGHGG
jgi:hypothetical protein